MKMEATLQDFLVARNTFLREPQTVEQIRAFQKRWNGDDARMNAMADISVLAGYYKARLGWIGCPKHLKEEATEWLLANGFRAEA